MKKLTKLLAVGSLALGLIAAPAAATAAPLPSPTSAVAPLSGGYPECGQSVLMSGSALGSSRLPSTRLTGLVNCTLNQGTVGDSVYVLQSALNQCYGKRLVVDGNFGPATRSALISVQAAVGASADGIFGPNTRDKILWAGYDSPCRTGYFIRTNYIPWYN